MIGQLNKLPLAIFLREIPFEGCHRLAVSDIKVRLVTFFFHVAKYFDEGLDDGGVGEVLDWDCLDVVRVVIIRHIIILIAVDGLDREGTCSIRVEGACVLVGECREAEHMLLIMLSSLASGITCPRAGMLKFISVAVSSSITGSS